MLIKLKCRKVKVKETKDCVIIGFTEGEGERERYFGSLQVAEREGDQLVYRGRVGTGFDDQLLRNLAEQFVALVSAERIIEAEVHEEKKTIWVNPQLKCEVEFSMITENGTFRDPVFKKLLR